MRFKLASQADLWYNINTNIVVPSRCWKQPKAWTHLIRRCIVNTVSPHGQNDKPLSNPGVYIIVNTTNGSIYVGSSVNVRRRWNEHRSSLRKGTNQCIILQNAWNKHGEGAFIFAVLEYVDDKNDRHSLEQRYIDELKPEYNAQPRVNIPGPRIYSDVTRAKISAAHKGRKHTEEYKSHMSEVMTGRQFTPEWIEHLKEAGARRVFTDKDKTKFQQRMNEPDIAAKRNQAIKGKKRTPEQKQRMRDAQLKRLQDPETKNAFLTAMNTPEIQAKRDQARLLSKLSGSRKGYKHTEEAKRKIGEASKARRHQAKLAKNNPTLWDGEELAP